MLAGKLVSSTPEQSQFTVEVASLSKILNRSLMLEVDGCASTNKVSLVYMLNRQVRLAGQATESYETRLAFLHAVEYVKTNASKQFYI